MKVGEVLNGYRIDTPPTSAGGGQSQWSFAEKEGQQYFVKMFLAPKFPLDDGPGSEAMKARKRESCLAFERRHLEIARRLDPKEPGGGNLVIPCDFFRVDSTYVKVMERVDAEVLPAAHRLTGHQLIVILRTLVFSLRLLHDKNVVHADVKPDNVLLKKTGPEIYVSKLIDFDEAYVVGEPPEPEHIVGDPVFYAPELLRYIRRDDTLPPDALATSADIFSLGLLVHSWLVGDVPGFDRTTAKYPAEAMLAGEVLDVSAAPEVIRPLLARMVAIRPMERPTISEIIQFLADVDAEELVPTSGPVTRVRPTPAAAPAAAPARPPAPARPIAPAGSRGPAPASAGTAGGLKGAMATPGRSASARPAGPPPATRPAAPPAAARPATAPAKPTERTGLRSTMGRKKPPPGPTSF